MKALLICPDERAGVAALAESVPLANVPILGKSLVEYWLAHLASLGATEVLILAVDRPDQVRAEVGDGARWGVRAIVQPEKRELTVDEARAKHQAKADATWLSAPNDVTLMDYLPSLPQAPLTTSYANWFAAARALMPCALTPDRIGVRELEPGVWVGMHAHVSGDATLLAPCWIEEGAWIEAGVTIGPNVVLEKQVFIASGAEVSHSVIGPKTFVGQFTEVRNSIALGSTLVNWESNSCLKVPDEFLLCSLEPHPAHPVVAKAAAKLRLREIDSQLLAPAFAEFAPPR
jgi:NDP-sugar pyrophosphorylase family protein